MFDSGSNPTMSTENMSSYRLHVDVLSAIFCERSDFFKIQALIILEVYTVSNFYLYIEINKL